jgi:predicted GH43/DUF377 family glycosyl hydrolase
LSLVDIHAVRLRADARRVVVRPFHLAWQATGTEPSRAARLIQRVSTLTTEDVTRELEHVYRDFDSRHWQVQKVFERRYDELTEQFNGALDTAITAKLTPRRRQLLGAYLCHEYSYASAAMMNPSIVAHPDQSSAPDGARRFLMSVRTVGEGHISTIAFIEGMVGPGRQVTIDEPPKVATAADVSAPRRGETLDSDKITTLYRQPECDISRTVIFPMTDAQRNGLEDLRLTPFDRGKGLCEYIGTYTAYDGKSIRSELLRTRDFRKFDLVPMTGPAARNKGMALFPRKVNGSYMMIGRQDGENLFLLKSSTLTHWEEGELIMRPQNAWEFIQLGNCGPPIELDEGWLLLTHGVGAMRRYSIGAILLDRDDPSKILGRSVRPLLEPLDQERDGYVPNVVYTCGAMRVGSDLFIPFGIADSSIGFGFVDIKALLAELV